MCTYSLQVTLKLNTTLLFVHNKLTTLEENCNTHALLLCNYTIITNDQWSIVYISYYEVFNKTIGILETPICLIVIHNIKIATYNCRILITKLTWTIQDPNYTFIRIRHISINIIFSVNIFVSDISKTM